MTQTATDVKQPARIAVSFTNPLKIVPRGWLQQQLEIQADGLSGHLEEFWPDIARSQWIGGDAEGWERGPYWLDGVIPLALQLQNPRLLARVQYWIDYILDHQHEDGWLGPLPKEIAGKVGPRDPWPVFVLMKAFISWQEATGDERIVPAMTRGLRAIQALLQRQPLTGWAKMRWIDLGVVVHWLYARTGEFFLLELAELAQAQGYDWTAHFETFETSTNLQGWQLENHGVNHAMALKEPAVRYLLSGDPEEKKRASEFIELMDRYHGQVNGTFSCDESLAGLNPSQGTELCTVTEYLYSLEVLLLAFELPELADRLEKIAFNALPATFKPDMWAHQYIQQVNQAVCRISEERIYTNNDADANIFGLEPHFGCCTANMHQGWPKFCASLWIKDREGRLTANSYAPCDVIVSEDTAVPVHLEIRTSYPFEESIRITIHTGGQVWKAPIRLRIPSWAEGARLSAKGRELTPKPGNYELVQEEWLNGDMITLHFPMQVRLENRYQGATSISRGPLVYSYAPAEEWVQLRGEAPHADWEVLPASNWNYALCLQDTHPESCFEFVPGSVGFTPFSPDGAPNALLVNGCLVPEWGLEKNAAAPPPSGSIVCNGKIEQIRLIPYGCTNLRITEFPVCIC